MRPASPGPGHRRGQVAFVLPGGSTRGAVQVGMLLALTEASIRPDFLLGTSVGALNAAVYSADPTVDGILALARLWETAPRAQIFPFSPLSMLRLAAARRGYLLPNDGLRRWIEAQTSFERLEDFPVPLHVTATDVTTRAPVILSAGESITALLATSAIPGVFPPIVIGDQTLCDGAVAADTPIREAAELGATTVYVLPTMPRASAPAEPPPGVTVHVLRAPRVADRNPLSFRASARLIERSYSLSRRWVAESIDADPARSS